MTTCKQTKSSKPPVRIGEYHRQLEHLTRLAKQPGWKAYAWARAQELDANSSGLWSGIADDLIAAMKSDADKGSA